MGQKKLSAQTLESALGRAEESRKLPEKPRVPILWRAWLNRFIIRIYFQRITLIHRERSPKAGPVLYLGLHRNGAVDGFVYNEVLKSPVFMISTQLRKNWFARLFFDGIAVTRTKDEGDHGRNAEAMRQCLDHLRSGGDLFVFPEGTSSLGPRHLPFRSGAAWLLLDYLEGDGPPLHVVPVGVHYECPWAFRSKVEVVIGPEIATELAPGASRMERLNVTRRSVEAALESVGVNVPAAEYQEQIERLAYTATLGTQRSYFECLKAMEQAVPPQITDSWQQLDPDLREAKLWLHQGVPLFPAGPIVLYGLALIVTGLFTLAAIIVNFPPFAAGWYAGKKFPDDRNVISLWKILVGVPVFALWLAVITVTMLFFRKIGLLLAYAAITWLGLAFYCRFKKLSVAVHNGLRCPALQRKMLAFHQIVLKSLPDETE